MKIKGSHLVFYDGECGLCDHIVQFLLKADKNQVFLFAPLQGRTAKKLLNELPAKYLNKDSVIFIENYQSEDKKIYLFGKAIFKICWLLGIPWSLMGLLSFLPTFCYDWAYRWVARHRKKWFPRKECLLPTRSDPRFLP